MKEKFAKILMEVEDSKGKKEKIKEIKKETLAKFLAIEKARKGFEKKILESLRKIEKELNELFAVLESGVESTTQQIVVGAKYIIIKYKEGKLSFLIEDREYSLSELEKEGVVFSPNINTDHIMWGLLGSAQIICPDYRAALEDLY